jgi:hypothetical protein
VTADYGDHSLVKKGSIAIMENYRHRLVGLSLLQIHVKLGPPTDNHSSEGDIRRSVPMDGNASHQLKSNAKELAQYAATGR